MRQAPVKILLWLKRSRLLLLEPFHDAGFRPLGGIAHLRGLKLSSSGLWEPLRRYPMLEADNDRVYGWWPGISGAANRNSDKMLKKCALSWGKLIHARRSFYVLSTGRHSRVFGFVVRVNKASKASASCFIGCRFLHRALETKCDTLSKGISIHSRIVLPQLVSSSQPVARVDRI